MPTDTDDVLLETEEAMQRATDYLRTELQGVRTGRASPGLIEHVKVDYYGSPTDLRQLALISAPEPTQLLVKPYDPSSAGLISQAIQNAGLGLSPVSEAKQVRINLPPLTGERRQQLVQSIKQMGEQAKVTIRGARREGNKQIEQAEKDKQQPLSEDEAESAKEQIQGLTKQHEGQVEQMVAQKSEEVQEI